MDNTTLTRITFGQRKQLENLKRFFGFKSHSQALDFILQENARLEAENKVFKDLEKSRRLQEMRK